MLAEAVTDLGISCVLRPRDPASCSSQN